MTAVSITLFILLMGALILCSLLWQKYIFFVGRKEYADFDTKMRSYMEQTKRELSAHNEMINRKMKDIDAELGRE